MLLETMNNKRKADWDGAHQGEAIDKSQVCFKAEDMMSFRIVKRLLLKELMKSVASEYAAHEWCLKLGL